MNEGAPNPWGGEMVERASVTPGAQEATGKGVEGGLTSERKVGPKEIDAANELVIEYPHFDVILSSSEAGLPDRKDIYAVFSGVMSNNTEGEEKNREVFTVRDRSTSTPSSGNDSSREIYG